MMSSENNTKRQHYVWRHYLNPWCQNEKIWCLRDNKIFNSNLMGIGQMRYFYRFNGLNCEEINLISKLFLDPIHERFRKMNQGWIDLFKNVTNKLLILKNNLPDGKENIDIIEKFKKNFEEKIHTHIENNSIKYLDSTLSENISFFNEDKGRMDFSNFIAHQYFRTKNMKSIFMSKIYNYENVDEDKINLDTVWNVSKFILSTNLGFNLYWRDNNFKIILLKNKTNVELITCDQPVINVLATFAKESEIPEKLDLYYPVAPNLAILITDNVENISKELSEIEVNLYNLMMVEQSHSQIYSYSKKELEIYLHKKI